MPPAVGGPTADTIVAYEELESLAVTDRPRGDSRVLGGSVKKDRPGAKEHCDGHDRQGAPLTQCGLPTKGLISCDSCVDK